MKLVIGNKNYSSWSLRPWLLLTHFGVAFEEVSESLQMDNLSQRLNAYSPSNRVPVFMHDELVIWDSLAICEYANEQLLNDCALPKNVNARAYARSISAEMHSGFAALRNAMPMNIRARRKVDIDATVQKDLARIEQIFGESRLRFADQSPWLAGEFSIADCMFAPVASRLKTYGVSLSAEAMEYVAMIHELPAMQCWTAAALLETEIVREDEAGTDR